MINSSSLSGRGTDAIFRKGDGKEKGKFRRKLTGVARPRTALTFSPPLCHSCLRSKCHLVAALSSPFQIRHCPTPLSRQTHARTCPVVRRYPKRSRGHLARSACHVGHFLAAEAASAGALWARAASLLSKHLTNWTRFGSRRGGLECST